MAKPRGRSHTTLTDTAKEVVDALMKCGGIKMIAPGRIDGRGGTGKRHVTAVYTTAGVELIISGQGVQKVAIHTEENAHKLIGELKISKQLQKFSWSERERKPGRVG